MVPGWRGGACVAGADYQGPVVNVFENDIVEANVINNGNLPQSTHCTW